MRTTIEKIDVMQSFVDCTPTEKKLRILPEYAKENILLYNGVK